MDKFEPYEIRVAMASDAGSSVSYLFEPGVPAVTRVYLRIKPRQGKVLWREAVINDKNYQKNYNQGPRRIDISEVPTLAIGGWFRHLLGIKRDSDDLLPRTELKIKQYDRSKCTWWRWWGSLRVSQQHPVSTNRIAMNLALLGVVLGVISLIDPFIHL
jgi:hypothetical protein